MRVLHAHLLIRRLTAAGAGELAQTLFDALFFDMDRSLRAMGVGDMSFGKRVKDMVRAFCGRTGGYDEALSMGDDWVVAATLARNMHGGAEEQVAGRQSRYVRATGGA